MRKLKWQIRGLFLSLCLSLVGCESNSNAPVASPVTVTVPTERTERYAKANWPRDGLLKKDVSELFETPQSKIEVIGGNAKIADGRLSVPTAGDFVIRGRGADGVDTLVTVTVYEPLKVELKKVDDPQALLIYRGLIPDGLLAGDKGLLTVSGGVPPYRFETNSSKPYATVDADTGAVTAGRVEGRQVITVTDSTAQSVKFSFWVRRPPGAPDLSFATRGAYPLPEGFDGQQILTGPEGQIYLLAGSSRKCQQMVIRLLPNGQPDDSFGDQGIVSLVQSDCENVDAASFDLSPTDGAPLVVVFWRSYEKNGTTVSHASLHRFLKSGAPDEHFGERGQLELDFSNGSAFRVQPDGKILVAGSRKPGRDRSQITVERRHQDGSIDDSFGKLGRTALKIRCFVGWIARENFVIQKNQETFRILVGASLAGPDERRPAIEALDPTGHRDESFGIKGIFTPSLPMFAEPRTEPEYSVFTGIDPTIPGELRVTGLLRSPRLPFIFSIGRNGELSNNFFESDFRAFSESRFLIKAGLLLADGSYLLVPQSASLLRWLPVRLEGWLRGGSVTQLAKAEVDWNFNANLENIFLYDWRDPDDFQRGLSARPALSRDFAVTVSPQGNILVLSEGHVFQLLWPGV